MFHREWLTGDTAAILEEILAMIVDVCNVSRSPKSQENDPFLRSMWQDLML